MNRHTFLVVGGFVSLAIVAGWLIFAFGGSHQVARAQTITTQLVQADESETEPPSAEKVEQLEKDLRGLSKQQTAAIAKSAQPIMFNAVETRLKAFFELEAEKQQAELDRRIDRIVRARELAKQRFPANPDVKPKKRWDKVTTQDKRDQVRLDFLNQTTPDLRALQRQYNLKLHQRMRERGVAVKNK